MKYPLFYDREPNLSKTGGIFIFLQFGFQLELQPKIRFFMQVFEKRVYVLKKI